MNLVTVILRARVRAGSKLRLRLARIATPLLCIGLVVGLFGGLLASCGSGDTSGVGGQGTGAAGGDQYGVVSGLGSVVVEGKLYQDSSATSRTVEFDPASPASIPAADIKLGMQTELRFNSTESSERVRILPTIVGTLERKDADSMVVAGQTVRLNTVIAPVLEGLANINELALEDRLEIHGYLDPAGQVIATRIERRDPAAPVQTRVTGLITAISNNNTRLQVGAIALVISGSTAVLPSGASFAVGQRVVAFAAAAPVAGVLSAKTIALDTTLTGSEVLRGGGVIRSLDRNAARFRLGATQVEFTTSVSYMNGSAADLADGRLVRVQGQVNNGLLRASEIRFLQTSADVSTELTGVITDYISSASFKVRAATVDASASNLSFRNGSASNFANGTLVKVEGQLADGIVRATKVEFIVAEDLRALAFRGTVSGYNGVTGDFALLGINMRLDLNATLTNNNGETLPRGSFSNGVAATASGRFVNGVFVVSAVEIEQVSSATRVRAEGIAYLVNVPAQSLRLNGQSVRWNGSTRIDGNLNDLRAGVSVRVEGTVTAGVLIVSRLTIRP